MREKNLVILCIVFAVLIGLVFVKKGMKPKVPTTEEIVDIIAPSVSADNITEIILRLGDSTGSDEDIPKNVHLTKEDDHWVVKTQYGVYANDKTIAPVLDKLDQLKGELRSDKQELFDDYGIADGQALHVELSRQGAEKIHIVVGTQKAGYQNNFVRFGGTNAVYLVNENLLATFGVRGEGDDQKLDVNKWTDKRISHMDVNNVVAIAITEIKEGIEQKVIDLRKELVDENMKWQSVFPYAFGLSASKIKKTVEVFNNTYAREVIAPDVGGVFDNPGWTGTFTLEGGEQVKIVRGEKDSDEKNYYVKREGAGYFYLVPVSTFDSREQQQGNIFADNPLKVEESNISKIEIRDIDSKKKFSALRKAPSEPAEASEEIGDQEVKKEDVWESIRGEAVDAAKVKDIINKIRSIKLEIVAQPAASLKGAVTISITKKEGESKTYTVSKDIKLDNGKECNFLKVKGEAQGYCVSKSQITALQNALP